MEDLIKKNKIRNIVIAIIVVIIGGVTLAGTTFRLADYNKELKSQIMLSEKILEDAEIGNENGMYSEYETATFKKSINHAKDVLNTEGIKNKEIKAEYKVLKEDQNAFQQASNTDIISAEELGGIKKEEKTFKKTVEFGDKEAVWEISPAEIKEEAAFNPAIKMNKTFESEIAETTKKLKTDVTSIVLMHNGKLPFTATLSIPFESEKKNVQVYRYDTKEKTYGSMIKGSVKKGKLSFSVEEGGIYVIMDKNAEDKDNTLAIINTESQKVKEAEIKKEEKREELFKETVSDEKKEESKKETNSDKGSSVKPETKPDSKPDAKPQPEPEIKPEPAPAEKYCTIEIRCDTIAGGKNVTSPEILGYIPDNGVILSSTKVKLEEGDTVYDVLLRVGETYGIPIVSTYNSVYNAAYIEGINHIFEKQAGGGSGWMYKVNGWFPDRGCSAYVLQDGEHIVWAYTCNMGHDIGAPEFK